MKRLIGGLRGALGNAKALSGIRKRIGFYLIMPWELPGVMGLPAAHYYPRFQRGHDNEEAAAEDIKLVVDYTMTKYDRCAVLHNIVKHLEDKQIPGSFVECGTWKGGSCGIMGKANLRYGSQRRDIHLLDAWGDYPDPTEEDGVRFEQFNEGGLDCADSNGGLDDCRKLMEEIIQYPRQRLFYHRGLFEKTVPGMKDSAPSIALLRVDCDWYNAVKYCLEEFYPAVSKGGIVVIDDYGYCEGARKAVNEFMQQQKINSMLHHVDYTCRYFIKDE